MPRRALPILLLIGMAVAGCDRISPDPTPLEAAAAALGTTVGKAPDGFAACVGFDSGDDLVDFPRGVTDALAQKRPAVRPISSCFIDRQRALYRIVQNGDPVPLIACGSARVLKPPRDPHSVRIECAVRHSGEVNAVGWGFDVRRTLWGSLKVTDLGRAWVS